LARLQDARGTCPGPRRPGRTAAGRGRQGVRVGAGYEADSAAAKNLQQAANLGSARILAMQKKPDEAVKLVQPIIDKLEAAKSDADVSDLLGSAYATRAFAQRAAGRNKEALYDFLRVHLLYNGAPDPHAEALYNLGQLWDQFHSPDRAKKARQTLLEQYKNTPWAKN